MLYYIQACFLRSPYFVTSAALLGPYSTCVEWSVYSSTITYTVIWLYFALKIIRTLLFCTV